MILNVIVDEQSIDLNVPDPMLQEAEDFFAKMDRDMENGWQMSRDWVDQPNREQRCQIAADKLLTALENENRKLAMLMAGYILTRMPGVQSVEVDTAGEIDQTRFTVLAPEPEREPAQAAPPPAPPRGGMSKLQALRQAAQDVTKVFKVGRNWRFSVFDHPSGQWRDSPTAASQQEAEALREQAYKQRFEALMGRSES
jgi:hypothetical protein